MDTALHRAAFFGMESRFWIKLQELYDFPMSPGATVVSLIAIAKRPRLHKRDEPTGNAGHTLL